MSHRIDTNVRLLCLAVGFATCGFADLVAADSLTVTPVKDNTLIEHPSGSNSNGMGDSIFAGRVGQFGGGARLRAVLAFDLCQIPPGSTINSVTLTLRMTQTVSENHTVTVHRVLANWGEGASTSPGGQGAPSEPGDATWVHTFYPDQFWTNVGGDFTSSASASQIVGLPGTYSWSSAGLTADVQNWVNNPGGNFGWLLMGNEAVQFSAKKFSSRNHIDPAQWPRLNIDFTPPPATCDADIAPSPLGDGVVNVNDLLAVINGWGQCPPPCPSCAADITGEGTVNVNDLLAVINSWGQCPAR